MLDCWPGQFLFWSSKIVFSSVELAAACSFISNKVNKKERIRTPHISIFFFHSWVWVMQGCVILKAAQLFVLPQFLQLNCFSFNFLFTYGMATSGHSVFPNRVSLSYFNYHGELYVFVLGWPVHSSCCAGFSGSWWTGKFSQNQDTSKWPSENRRCIWRYIIQKGVRNVLLKISKLFRQLLFSFPRILVVPSVLGVIEMLIN